MSRFSVLIATSHATQGRHVENYMDPIKEAQTKNGSIKEALKEGEGKGKHMLIHKVKCLSLSRSNRIMKR